MASAPLQRDAIAFAGVLLDIVDRTEEGRDFPTARSRLATAALTVVEEVVLALRSHDPGPHLYTADDALAVARAHLLIALGLGLLTEEAHLALMDQADCIGRQVGALLRRLDPAAPEPRARHPRSRKGPRLSEAKGRARRPPSAPKP